MKRLTVGDKAIVTKDQCGNFKKGEVVKIVGDDKSSTPYLCKNEEGRVDWMEECDLVPIPYSYIELSEDTLANIKEHLSEKKQKPIRLGVKIRERDKGAHILSIDGNDAMVLYTKNIAQNTGDFSTGFKKSGYGAYAFLGNLNGQWLDESGTPVSGYLYYNPHGEA